ncbi:MAG: CDP-glucose 4,6-dehydratase [Bacteriovorax sp.]|nr:CDP-glucose 4,6-dehydratase [Bacteriovorax sp.]
MYFKNKFKNKKVAVIGHTGFKGSWLTAWLNQLGAEVAGFSKDIPTTPSHFELAHLDQNILDVRGNIVNYNEILKFLTDFKPDILFHMGANAIVSDCLEHPQDAFLTNSFGTVNVLEAIRHTPSLKSVVIVTSDKCYENIEWEFGYRENDRLGGKDPYSASKACAEIIFSSYFRTYLQFMPHLSIATARAGNVIGGGDWAANRIIPDCIRSWTKSESVQIRNPEATRPWQHVLEPLSGYLLLASELLEGVEGLNGESFNIGPKAEVNKAVSALIEEMQHHWKNVKVDIDKSHHLNKKEASLLKLCCDKALNRLGWMPTLTFNETVEMTALWYRNWHEIPVSVKEFTDLQIKSYGDFASKRGMVWTKN